MTLTRLLKNLDQTLDARWQPDYPITERLLDTHLHGQKLSLLDGGAAGGSLAEWTRLDAHLIRYGFDPDGDECARLNAEAAAAGYEHHYYPRFLAERDEAARPFYLTHHPHSHSLYRPNAAYLQRIDPTGLLTVKERITVETTSLATWATEAQITEIDFIKLDVQGAELEILRGGETLLPSVLGLLLEVSFVPVYEGMPLFAEVDSFLRERGFTFFSQQVYTASQFAGRVAAPVNIRHMTTFREQQVAGQLVTADVLYLRDMLADDAPPPVERLLKLACLAEMCGQIEYSFEVLAHLRERGVDIGGLFEAARQAYQQTSLTARLFRLLRILALRGPRIIAS